MDTQMQEDIHGKCCILTVKLGGKVSEPHLHVKYILSCYYSKTMTTCTVHGNNPPCLEGIILQVIKRMVYSMLRYSLHHDIATGAISGEVYT